MPPATEGPIRLIREGITDIRSRRRLVSYLVQADIRKRGADTLLGNIWWVLDPLLQMAVYVVFVTIVVDEAAARLPALHLRRDPALEVVHRDDDRRHGLDRGQGPADQADPVPRRSSCRRRRRSPGSSASAFGTDRAAAPDAPLPAPDHAVSAVHPGHRGRPVRVHACLRVPDGGRERLLPGPRQCRDPRPAAGLVPVAGAVQPRRPRPACTIFKTYPGAADARRAEPVRHPVHGLPDGHLRDVDRRRPRLPNFARSGGPARRQHHLPRASRPIVFKRLEPNFAKVV